MTPGKAFLIGALSKTIATIVGSPSVVDKQRSYPPYRSPSLTSLRKFAFKPSTTLRVERQS